MAPDGQVLEAGPLPKPEIKTELGFVESNGTRPSVTIEGREVLLPEAWRDLPKDAQTAIAKIMVEVSKYLETHKRIERPMPASIQGAFNALHAYLQDPAKAEAVFKVIDRDDLSGDALKAYSKTPLNAERSQLLQMGLLDVWMRQIMIFWDSGVVKDDGILDEILKPPSK